MTASTARCPAILLAVVLSLSFCRPPSSLAQAAGGYGDYSDWMGWARVNLTERPGLASSADPSGSDIDFNHYEYPPGFLWGNRPATAATITGPGIIYRFWMPHRIASYAIAVKMYFDGEPLPRIDSSSDEILDGTFAYFGAPLDTAFAGGQVCYETIPFRDSVRIDTENRLGVEHYYQYTYRTFAPGTDISSWSGVLDPETAAARLATVGMFQNLGHHPAGDVDPSAVRCKIGPTSVPGGGSLALAELGGPGVIRALTIRLHDPTDDQLENLILRGFWDVGGVPAIEAPVGWFFGAGRNRVPYRSLPLGSDSPSGFYSYWPMPYRYGARIVLVNQLSTPIPIDSTVVEYIPGPVDTTLGCFHAVARQEVRAQGTNRFVMLQTQGTGHYVGNMLFLDQDVNDDRMLEGDDEYIVDQAVTLHGTGLEDVYNGGYYYNWYNPMPEPEGGYPASAIRPLNGLLRKEKRSTPPYARADQYRWMIADRVSFTQSLEVRMETGYSIVGARWKSVAFWYQLPDVATGAPPPAGSGSRLRGLEVRSIEPNPAADGIVIRFTLPADGAASLQILDVAGRLVATLGDGPLTGGVHEVRWSRGGVPDGVYFLRLRANGLTASRKLVLVH